tara:strand:- start:276 stop:569 length:294 start_codon:yes stop_codon:yes gene_type:complete
MSKKTDAYLQEAIKNIRDDRVVTKTLLDDLMSEIKSQHDPYDAHKELGTTAAKYVETLQRSNEQLVKIASLLEKKAKFEGLSEIDKNEIFEAIQGAN